MPLQELVERAQSALADEITHTKLCFALASRYAGRALGPGPLPVSGALENGSFFDAVATAITEACIGETLAAIEAAEAAEQASDPEVRSALLTIAADESKHAELGWKFLRWAFDKVDAGTRARLVEHLHREVARELAVSVDATDESSACDDATLLAHGVLTPALRAEVRTTTLNSLILPLAKTLSDSERRLVA